MTTKQYLSQAFYLDKLIDAKLEQRTYLREHISIVSPVLTADRVKGGERRNRTEDLICKLADLETEIDEDIDNLCDIEKGIKGIINELSDQRHRLLLTLRYLNFKSWDEIADIMGYSLRSLHYIHGQALVCADESLHTIAH